MRLNVVVITLAALALCQAGQACLWDYDTLAMEKARFPEAHELIAGYFLRHSDAYYAWRIADRETRPEAARTPADYDDIAVAQDKLGRHDAAIATIRAKMARWPDAGRYESEANLGTFLIHAGRLEEGIVHIDKAIAINPDAHFGREIYQKLLVQYVLAVRAGANTEEPDVDRHGQPRYDLESVNDTTAAAPLPLYKGLAHYRTGFTAYIMEQSGTRDRDTLTTEMQAATKGVLGMMRFGNHESPVLLEALGDLLMSVTHEDDSKMLAARAYLRASYLVDDPGSVAIYREKAELALEEQHAVGLADVEAALQAEMAEGAALFARISADEAAWIAAGQDVDALYAATYYQDPEFDAGSATLDRLRRKAPALIFGLVCLGVLLSPVVLIALIIRRNRRQKRERDELAASYGRE